MSLAQKSLALLTRDVVMYGARIVTSVIVARTLGPEVMGIWIILMLLPSYAEAIGRIKVDVAAVYFLGARKYGFAEVSFVLALLSLVSGGVLVLVGLWQSQLIESYLFQGTVVDHNLLYAVLITIPLSFVSTSFSYLLIHLEDVKSYNWLSILRGLLPSLLAVPFIVVFHWGLWSLIVASLFSLSLTAIYGYWKCQRYEPMRPNFNRKMLRDMVSYAANNYFGGLIGQVNTYFAGLVVVRFILPSEMAFFRMGQDTTQLASKVPDALSSILYPRISKISSSPAQSQQLATRACRISVVLLSFVGVAGGLGIYPLVYLLYGTAYMPMAVYFLIILPGVLAVGCSEPVAQYLQGTGRANTLLRLSLFPLVAQISLCLSLIPVWGAVGASVATSLVFLTTALARSVAFSRITHVPFSQMFVPTSEDVMTVARFALSTRSLARLPVFRSAKS